MNYQEQNVGQDYSQKFFHEPIFDFNRPMQRLEQAFCERDQKCACIDEGMTEGQVRMAGSGILHPGGANEVARLLRAAGIVEVTSHEGCGAAKKAAVDKGFSPDEAEARGSAFCQEVVKYMNEMRSEDDPAAIHRHIMLNEMQRPRETHDAVAVYYDTTGHFNPASIAELPKGFVTSRRYNDQAAADADLAVQIALGDHGHGREYFERHPLYLVAVGEKDTPVFEQAFQELKNIADRYATMGINVRLEKLIAPPRQ